MANPPNKPPDKRPDTLRRINPADLHARAQSARAALMQRIQDCSPTSPACPPGSPPVPTSPEVCAFCQGAGWYKKAVAVTHDDFGKLFPCSCTDASRAKHAEAARQARLVTLARELGPKLASCRFEDIDLDREFEPRFAWGGKVLDAEQQRAGLRRAYRLASDYAARPMGWLALFGPPGTGKSHLSAAIANDLARHGNIVTYASERALFAHLRQGFSDHSTDARLQDLQETPVLVLDDVGASVRSDFTDEWLWALLNHRGMYELPTVISSNAVPATLERRVADRIDEFSTIAFVICSSYRSQIRLAREATR